MRAVLELEWLIVVYNSREGLGGLPKADATVNYCL